MRLDGPAGDLRSNRLTLKRPTSYCHPNSHTCSLVFRFVRSPLLLGCMRAATHLASKKAVSPLAESSGMHLWCFPLVIGWRRLTTFYSKKEKAHEGMQLPPYLSVNGISVDRSMQTSI